jgi:uncharacterized DUF497 family protein
MNFEWDAQKARRIFAERGIDLNDMVLLWLGPRVEIRTDQNGEARWKTIGELEDRIYTVVFTMRGDTIRLITARRAWDSEERAYRESITRQGEGWPH